MSQKIFARFLIAWLVTTLCLPLPILADVPFNISPLPSGLPFNSGNTGPGVIPQIQRQQLPIKREMGLEDLLPRLDYPCAFLQPAPLKDVKIPGLTERAVEMLGSNYFVAIENTKFRMMSEIYKQNRLKGKANFITGDAIVHPYFAFTNRVLASVITEEILPKLSSLLKAMLEIETIDYNQAQDKEVKDDLAHNVAFLSVAVKLIDPKFFPSAPLSIVKMIQADLDSIYSGSGTESLISGQPEDFSFYIPIGWYNTSPELQNFYRCREWITRMTYPLTDVVIGGLGESGNNFRRSVLLYRSLDLASVDGRPAYETWSKLCQVWPLLGSSVANLDESSISASEYKSQINFANPNLKVTLKQLAEPFFRTRLLLAIRKQKPMSLKTTSVFELDSAKSKANYTVSFRLFPLVGDPEWQWMKACVSMWQGRSDSFYGWPLALLDLHAWQAPQANNSLLDNFSRLDPNLINVLPTLDHLVRDRQSSGLVKTIEDRRWQILSSYFKPLPDGAQNVVRTTTWMTRMLESAFAGWIDSHLAIAPEGLVNPKPEQNENSAEDNTNNTADTTNQNTRTKARTNNKAALFHYVQPSPELFKNIARDANKLIENLTAIGYFPANPNSKGGGKYCQIYKERFNDFIRLSNRLEKIAACELKGQPLSLTDIKLLQDIDLILEKVDTPLANTLSLNIGKETKIPTRIGSSDWGATFALGRPGQLFIIMQKDQNWMLGRGAVYTYFEFPEAEITEAHWTRKLDNSLITPPYWADKFDLVQNFNEKPIKRRPTPPSNPTQTQSKPKNIPGGIAPDSRFLPAPNPLAPDND